MWPLGTRARKTRAVRKFAFLHPESLHPELGLTISLTDARSRVGMCCSDLLEALQGSGSSKKLQKLDDKRSPKLHLL
jgi:hypothetical protein